MQMRILTEASGSMTAAYLIKAIREAGHLCVASDIDDRCFGRYLADDFAPMPRTDSPFLWEQIEEQLAQKKIDLVIPSLDETLLGWAERKDYFRGKGVEVVLSDAATVAVCQDKWLTYRFFADNRIPTPATSLTQDFPLVKPRCGRGAVGVRIAAEPVEMAGNISQEVLEGVEYTVDVFCDHTSTPLYIVPRKRIGVREGKSTGGITEHHPAIIEWVETICRRLPFTGPVNIQCFAAPNGSIKFLEINPRIAGGMALGFAATENWVELMVKTIVQQQTVAPKPVSFGMEMKRYYAEVIVPAG